MALTKYLRDTVDARFTNKAAKITNAEYDETLRSFHDDIDAINANLALVAGGILQGIEVVTSTPTTITAESPNVVCRTDDTNYSILLPTAMTDTPGTVVTICDENGNANANPIVVTCESGDLIAGAANYTMSVNWQCATFMSIDDNGTPAVIVRSTNQ